MTSVAVAAPCTGTTKAGGPCRTAGTQPDGRCWFHSAHVTPEQRSAAGRAGAATTNHRSSTQKVARELAAAQAAEQAAAGALRPAEVALVAPAVGPVDIHTPEAVEAVISKAVGAVLDGTLPPSRSKAVAEMLKVRLELAGLSISQRLLALEARLKEQKGGTRRRKGAGR